MHRSLAQSKSGEAYSVHDNGTLYFEGRDGQGVLVVENSLVAKTHATEKMRRFVFIVKFGPSGAICEKV